MRFVSIEELNEDTVVVDDATPAEIATASAEVEQQEAEIITEVERTQEAANSAETIDAIAERIETQPVTESGLGAAEIAVEALVARLGGDRHFYRPSLESIGERKSVAIEGFRDTADKIWRKIVEFIRNIWVKISTFFANVFNLDKLVSLRAKRVVKKAQELKAAGLTADKLKETGVVLSSAALTRYLTLFGGPEGRVRKEILSRSFETGADAKDVVENMREEITIGLKNYASDLTREMIAQEKRTSAMLAAYEKAASGAIESDENTYNIILNATKAALGESNNSTEIGFSTIKAGSKITLASVPNKYEDGKEKLIQYLNGFKAELVDPAASIKVDVVDGIKMFVFSPDDIVAIANNVEKAVADRGEVRRAIAKMSDARNRVEKQVTKLGAANANDKASYYSKRLISAYVRALYAYNAKLTTIALGLSMRVNKTALDLAEASLNQIAAKK